MLGRRQVERAAPTALDYQPALDGLRAVSVALVLIFHAGFGWMSGGYVGVSVFFTLSGFLITTLALYEHDRRGRLDVGAFYARRLRRLLPASLLCLVGVSVAASLGLFGGATNLRGDVWAAIGQVYNWVALADGGSYADAITGGAARTAPLEHYWSLAVEEQFYWIWPLVLLALLRAGSRVRRLVLGGLVVAFALAAPFVAHVWGPAAAYWATPARFAEILVGAFAGLVVHDRRRASQPLPRGTSLAAPVGLLAIVGAAVTWPAGSGPAYAGWLPVFALASVAVIVGVQLDGPVRRLLARPPLVALGAISYGIYLYHWPVYALLDEARTGLDRVPLFALRVAVTLVVAATSYALVERPVRESRWTIRPVSKLAVAGCAVLAALVVVLPIDSPAYWAGSGADRRAVVIETFGADE
ncbi:MAG: acyltransferase, partial [Acidimicrobiia bacterium]|nr:acyltransferase [Acidimicrobiia bacterium]